MANGTRTLWTPEVEEKFLDLVMTTANISRSAKSLNISTSGVYDRKKENPAFAAKLAEARTIGAHVLEDVCFSDALDGINEPVFFEGKQIVDAEGNPIFLKKYSTTLRIFLLNGAFPEKYRHRWAGELSGPAGGPISLRGTVQIYIPDNGRAVQADVPAETAPGTSAVETKTVK